MVVKLNGHFYWRAEENDALYNAGSIAVRGGALASDRRIGTELDLSVQYKFDRHLTGLFGYSHFFTDDFIENSGPHSDIDFVYVSMQYTF
jgi:hypothetical protein